ncbi:exonuclease SbcCD subunit D [Gorillibacterium sp. sgz5001074]|uniref:exonuclease SbcCD subunit D n=1 Tax=Gorillibacterium sp. sgz5001074 TaxID=3446695 RepID=UPI003F67DADC
MRILHTADWHLGRTLEGRSRQAEQEAFLDELAEIVRRESIDLVLLAGDIYDSVNPPSMAEKLFYDSLSRLAEGGKRHVAVIAGNHDSPERLAAADPLAERHGIRLWGLPLTGTVEYGIPRTGERAVLYPLPYPSESRLGELLADEADEAVLRSAYSDRIRSVVQRASLRFRPDTVNLIMSHLYVLGGSETTEVERPIQVGGAYTVDPSALCAGAHYTALGHLHRPQYVKADSLIRYSGSPLAYSFSEAGQAKSVTILDAAPGSDSLPLLTELPLSSGRPLVEWKAAEGIEQVHRWLDEGRDSRAWIDLTVRLTETLSMDQLQELRKRHEGIIHIRPVYPEMEAEELGAVRSLPLNELFRRFYSRQTGGAEPDEELVRLFLTLLHPEEREAAAGREETP